MKHNVNILSDMIWNEYDSVSFVGVFMCESFHTISTNAWTPCFRFNTCLYIKGHVLKYYLLTHNIIKYSIINLLHHSNYGIYSRGHEKGYVSSLQNGEKTHHLN